MRNILILLCAILTYSTTVLADTTYDVVIPADQIDISTYENNLESRLKTDITSYLGNSEFVLSVEAKITKIQRMIKNAPSIIKGVETSSEIFDYELPGLLNVSPTSLKTAVSPSIDKIQTTFRKIDKLTVKITLDTNISAEKEAFIRNLITHKGKLDTIRGDSIDITKANMSGSTFGDLFSSDEQESSSFTEGLVYKLVMALLVIVLILAIVAIIIFFKRRMSLGSTPNQQNMASLGSQVENLFTSNSNLEHSKQDLVSLSLSNKGLAEETLKEIQFGAEPEKSLAAIYLTLGERLFNKLYPSVDSTGIKNYLKDFTLEKTEIEALFEEFTTTLAEKNENYGEKYRPFHFLDNLDNAQILYLLQDESTKITALLLSQLSTSRSATIIQSLEKSEQAAVAFELSQFDKLPIESFKDVANKLAIKAQRVPSYSNIDIDGEQILLNMLDNMSQTDVNEFLAKLRSDSPDTYYKLRDVYFIFDDLVRIPTKILKTIVREFSRSDIALAMQDSDVELSSHLLGAMPARLSAAISEELELNKSKPNIVHIEEAKQNITNVVRHLIKHNRLSVSDLVKEDR